MLRRRLPAFLSLLFISAVALSQTTQSADKKPARVRTLDELADRKVTLDLKEATLKDALDALFKKVPVNRMVMFDPGVDTKITLKVEDVPFEGALVCILRSVKRQPLSYSDAGGLLLISPNTRERGASAGTKFWVDVKDVDVRYAVKALMSAVHADYSFDPGGEGPITATITAEAFDATLKRLCENKASPITFKMEDGLYRFSASK